MLFENDAGDIEFGELERGGQSDWASSDNDHWFARHCGSPLRGRPRLLEKRRVV